MTAPTSCAGSTSGRAGVLSGRLETAAHRRYHQRRDRSDRRRGGPRRRRRAARRGRARSRDDRRRRHDLVRSRSSRRSRVTCASTTDRSTRRAASSSAPWRSATRPAAEVLLRVSPDGTVETLRDRHPALQRHRLLARRRHDLPRRHRSRTRSRSHSYGPGDFDLDEPWVPVLDRPPALPRRPHRQTATAILWVAQWGGSSVRRHAPDRASSLDVVSVDATQASCPAFVGPRSEHPRDHDRAGGARGLDRSLRRDLPRRRRRHRPARSTAGAAARPPPTGTQRKKRTHETCPPRTRRLRNPRRRSSTTTLRRPVRRRRRLRRDVLRLRGDSRRSPTIVAERVAAGRTEPVGERRFGAPFARPHQILCIGLNYSDHAAETGQAVPAEPILFTKSPNTLIGPNDDVLIPRGSQKTDWEVELGIVIGRHASYLADETEAAASIAGYVLVNDVSEREWQIERGGQWSKGKSAPTFNPAGPYLVTPDEIGDVLDLDMWLEIDGDRPPERVDLDHDLQPGVHRALPEPVPRARARRPHQHRHPSGRRHGPVSPRCSCTAARR